MGEKKADDEQYEKLACWCENNRKGKTAVTVLEKHHSFLQVDSSSKFSSMTQLRASLKKIVQDNDDLINQILNPKDQETLAAFTQGGNPSYSSQSSEIFGVLKQMQE